MTDPETDSAGDIDAATRDWLLDTDPALRWQVERDLLDEPPSVWEATRTRVAEEGYGAALLGVQDPDGQWAGGAYFPHDAREDEPGQPWTATAWSLSALREWGLPPDRLGDTAERLRAHSTWEYDDLPFWEGEVDACINAMTLANGAWLGTDVSCLEAWFPEHRLADGGWNCEWVEGSTRSSLMSTLNSLRGLLAHEQLTGGSDALREARHGGEEYLLERRLLRRLSTGEVIEPGWNAHPPLAHHAYPFRWFYSPLKALDHFRDAALLDGTPPDERLAETVELVRAAADHEGRWRADRRHPGRVWFDVDVPEGQQSPWLTFLALRVLRWWDSASNPA